MALESLSLQNVYGFGRLHLAFEPDLTVLVGRNGAGKTSILSAIRQCVGTYQSGFSDLDPSARRVDASERSVATLLEGSGRSHTIVLDDHLRARESVGGLTPVFCYGVERHVVDSTPGATDARGYPRESAFEGWHDAPRSYETFFRWFREMEDLENEAYRHGDARPHPGLAAVRSAVTQLLPEYTSVEVRRRLPPYSDKPVLALTRDGRVLPFSFLSEGERTTIAMVADIARRLALLGGDAPLTASATVLVDEIELHAHPAWQRRLVSGLRRVFPNVQWVLTTHSPVVVQECEPRQLRVLRDFRLVDSHHGTGLDANAVLEDVFGEPSRRSDVQAALEAVRDAIDDRDYPRARRALDELAARTEDGPDAVFFRTLLSRIGG